MATGLEWIFKIRDGFGPQLKRIDQRTESIRQSIHKTEQATTGSFKDMAQAADRYDDQLGEVDQHVAKTGAQTDDVFGKGGRRRTGGLRGGLSKIKGQLGNVGEMIPGIGSSLSSLATPASAAAAAVGTVAVAAGKVVAETVQAANRMYDLRLETQRLAGLSGKELSNATAKIAATAKTFGKDQTEVLKTANTMAKQMGTSVDGAIEHIRAGLLAGVSEDFLQQVQEYAPQFEKAGIKANEMVSTLVRARKMGIWTDKLPDAIKEAGNALQEGTKPVKEAVQNAFGKEWSSRLFQQIKRGSISAGEAMQRIAEKADKAGLNVQERQQLITEVFKSAGEDAGPKLLSVLRKMGESSEKLAEMGGKQAEHKQKELDIQDKITKTTERIGRITGPMAKKWELMKLRAKAVVVEWLQPMFKWVQGIIEKFRSGEGMLGQWGNWLKLLGTLVWEGIKFGFELFVAKLQIAWKIIKVITWPFRKLFDWIMSMVGGVEGIQKAFDKVNNRIQKAWIWIKAIYNAIAKQLRQAINEVEEWFSRLFNKIKNWLQETYNKVVNFAQSIFQPAWEWITWIFDKIWGWIRPLYNAIAGIVKSVFGPVWNWISGIFDKIWGWISSFFDWLKSLGGKILEGIGVDVDAVQQKVSKVGERSGKDKAGRMSQEKADRFAGMLGRGGGNQSRGGLSGGGGSGPQSSGEDKQVAAATASGGGDTNITINMDQLVSFDVRSTNGKLELTQEDLNKIYQQLLGLLNNATGMAGS